MGVQYADLRRLALLDGEQEMRFDRVTELVRDLLDVPLSLVTIIDDHRQFFKSLAGEFDLPDGARETPLDRSLCKHVVYDQGPLVVDDATNVKRLRSNPAVLDGEVVAYIGTPVHVNGEVVGSLCGVDHKPRDWSEADLSLLKKLAAIVDDLIERNQVAKRLDGALQQSFVLIDELTSARLEELRVNEEKTRLLSVLSHEIRNPLTIIIGNSEVLRDDPLTPRQERAADVIEASADGVHAVCENILDHSRKRDGERPLKLEEISPKTFAEECVDAVRGMAEAKALKVSARVDAEVPDALVTDKARLRQILFNFLGNALKFTGSGGVELHVGLAATPEAPTIRFAVEDTGPGIPEADLEKVFLPYAQLGTKAPGIKSGVGLGMAIAKDLAEELGAEIGVASAVGQGSTFWVDLPLRQAHSAS